MKYLIVFLFMATQSALAIPGQVNLAWDASPTTDVTGYRLYWGTKSQTYTAANSVDVGKVLAYNLSALTPGTVYFIAVTAYNALKIESPYSNEVSLSVPLPPIQLKVSPQLVSIQSFQGANLLVKSTNDLKAWLSMPIQSTASDTVTFPVDKKITAQFYQASYQDLKPVQNMQLKPLPPLQLTKLQMLKLFLRYRPGHHPDSRKGAELLTGKR